MYWSYWPEELDKTKKKKKRHPVLKERGKTIFIWRWHNLVYTKSSGTQSGGQEPFRVIKFFFNKISRHKTNTQKSTGLLYIQFSSVTQSCPTFCDPMNRSTPGLPVHHQCLEFTQTHAHRVGDVIQPSHPLSSPSPPAPNPSQHQGLF